VFGKGSLASIYQQCLIYQWERLRAVTVLFSWCAMAATVGFNQTWRVGRAPCAAIDWDVLILGVGLPHND